jgi:hypothetical protein
LLRE